MVSVSQFGGGLARRVRAALLGVAVLPLAGTGAAGQSDGPLLRASIGPVDTLDGALRRSIADSPTLGADAERQKGVESQLRGAVDAFMPTIDVVYEKMLSSRYDYFPDIPKPTTGLDSVQRGAPDTAGIQATLPLFDGFRRWNDLQAARRRVDAGRHLSIAADQQVRLDTATAYLSVIRDRAVLGHRRAQAVALEKIRLGTTAQFETRDATLSDVSRTVSRLEGARVAIREAEAQLARSEADYRRLTGNAPTRLAAPTSAANLLPRSVEDLRRAMREESPQLAASRLEAEAAGHDARSAVSALAPRLDVKVVYGREWNYSETLRRQTETTAKLSLTIPVYQPGTLPKLEQAGALARQRRWETIDAERKAEADAEALFAEHRALGAELDVIGRRVRAMRAAAEALRVEQAAGYRTVIDTLDAESELGDVLVARETIAFERERIGYTIAAALARIGEPGAGTTRRVSWAPWGGLLASAR